MKSSINIDEYRKMFIKNTKIEEIHIMPNGALIYRSNSGMSDQLMEYNMFRVDEVYRDILLDGFNSKNIDDLIKIYGEKKVCSKISHAYFNGLIDFQTEILGLNVDISGSKSSFYPPHMAIELTDICNLSCKHCYRQAGYKGKYIEFEACFKLS